MSTGPRIDWESLAADLHAALAPESGVRREEPLATRTTLRVGGSARILAEPASEADLASVLQRTHAAGVPVIMLGRGSNLLVPDSGVDAVVISLGHPAWQRLKNLCGLASKAGLVGFEFLEGIPGNVGGALRMNAGAMGGWMFDVVEEVRVMARDGTVRTYRKAEMKVDYRHCAELEAAIAVEAVLRPARVAPGEDETIRRQIDAYRDKRHQSQPREPSAGCMFKNPPGDSAGRLIDAAGLKGERVGGAEVSTVHANFIINRGGATAADVITLVRRVRERVQGASGVTLEPEVLLYGGDWRKEL